MSFCMRFTSNQASSGRSSTSGPRARSIGEPTALEFKHVDRELGIDAAPFGEQDALAERNHLHGEADVDGELHHQCLSVLADVGDGVAELTQERLDPGKRGRIAADHDREAARLGSRHAARHGRVEHRGAELPYAPGELPAGVAG